MGFPVPLQEWVQGHSREFVGDILFSRQARERGIYNMAEIDSLLNSELR